MTRETLHEVVKPWRLNGGMRPYKPVGCLDCRMTGYRGRAGLYELLTVSDAARGCIHPVPDTGKLRAQALQDGLRPLRLAGAMKVAEGVTTIDEVLARARPAAGSALQSRAALSAMACKRRLGLLAATCKPDVARRMPCLESTSTRRTCEETRNEDQEPERLLVGADVSRRRRGLCRRRDQLHHGHFGRVPARVTSRSAWAC